MNFEFTQFSASDLVKRSAAQILFLNKKKQEIITSRMANGVTYQTKIVKDNSLSNTVADEMRGCYTAKVNNKDIQIFYCIDMIKDGCFYEIKSVQDELGNPTNEYPDWYLKSSLLQCAVYKSLLIVGNTKKLYTPKFRLKQGYKKENIDIDYNANYYLIFGDIAKYQINVNNPTEIVNFYLKKIRSMSDFDHAKSFDSKFKFKEYDILKPYFEIISLDS